MNWIEHALNARSFATKKYLFELLQARYGKHEPIIERIAASLVLEKDMEAFNRLILEVYDTAYQKCVQDHKEQLGKMGFKVNIVPSQNDG